MLHMPAGKAAQETEMDDSDIEHVATAGAVKLSAKSIETVATPEARLLRSK